MIAGTLDCIFQDNEGNYLLYDWKRRPILSSDNRKKAIIQLNLYRILYEETGQKIKRMYIASIFPTNSSIILDEIPIIDVVPEVQQFLVQEKKRQEAELEMCSKKLGKMALSLAI